MIQVKYEIFCTQKTAPVFTSYDKLQAKVEFDEFIHNSKGDVYRLAQTPMPGEELTKPEEYVLLVYQVRKAIRKFFDGGRNHEDFLASLALEKQLDQWNVRTRTYLNNHPNAKADEKSKAFFLLVEKWRDKWHKYFATKKSKAEPEQVIREMKKECEDYEKQIDKYVKQVIGLL